MRSIFDNGTFGHIETPKYLFTPIISYFQFYTLENEFYLNNNEVNVNLNMEIN